MVVVEGPRQVETALKAAARFRFALGREGGSPALLNRLQAAGVEIVTIEAARWAEFADTETPQDIIVLAEEPRPPLPPAIRCGNDRVLILDQIQDPGNAGTLVRSAAALGVNRILALDGTVDLWNAKAVRASAGTGFLIPIHRLAWAEARHWLDDAELTTFVADAAGTAIGVSADLTGGRGWALVVGNEGRGVREEIRADEPERLAIPMHRGVESLNAGVAGTLLLWALLGPSTFPDEMEPLP